MSAIHLTDAQRDTFAACRLIVIDGEYSADGGERALQRMQQMNMPQGSDKLGRPYHQVTGHPLSAPEGWRILTEPCDTCGGRGHAVDPYFLRKKPCPNPDCVGGRRVVTFTATCPNIECGDVRVGPCPRCGNRNGPRARVELGRFTIPALLPVVAKPSDSPDKACIVPLPQRMVLYWPDRPHPEVERHDGSEMLGPIDVRPGQFIARPERVE